MQRYGVYANGGRDKADELVGAVGRKCYTTRSLQKMQTKPLLYGLIGFFLGGLLVAVAATTFNKPSHDNAYKTNTSMNSMSMDDMTATLKSKTGDEFDKAFIASMIAHHESAVEMAELSAKKAKHDEIKTLSSSIISAQEKEISEMKQWQIRWGYMNSNEMNHGGH